MAVLKLVFCVGLLVGAASAAAQVVPMREPIIPIGPKADWKSPKSSSPAPSSAMPEVICSCPDQCDAMWLEATSGLQTYSGMKLRVITDFMLETFTRDIGITGTVSKRPLGGGRYEMLPEFYPRPSTGQVANLAYTSKRLLSQDMVRAASKIQCPAPASPEPGH